MGMLGTGLSWGCITSLLIVIQDFLVSGVRYQQIRFLLLTPDCKAFAQKMNKLMGDNHFNKSVMLPILEAWL